MTPVIDLAPGARDEPLAQELQELVASNVRRDPAKRRDLGRLRGAVAIVADDLGVALTLRFDFGRLMIHLGIVGTPDVTFRGNSRFIRGLGRLPSPTVRGLTIDALRDRGARQSLGDTARALSAGGLKIYGLALHPRLVTRLLHVLSRPQPAKTDKEPDYREQF